MTIQVMADAKSANKTNAKVSKNETNPVRRKAVIFARVSTARQEKEGLSLTEIQIPRAEEYAKKHGLEVDKVFAVSETGGQYKIRKKFAEMIDYVKKNKSITDVIAFRVDRITRNFQDAVVVDDLRSKFGKRIHFIDDNFILDKDSKSNDILQWDMKVLIARQYLERVKEDGQNSKLSKLQKGELPWSAPFGYMHTKLPNGTRTVIEHPTKGKVAKEILRRYSTGMYSLKSLSKEIEQEFGVKLVKDGIYRIVTSKFYYGVLVDAKTGMEYPHIYEPMITRDLYERNQEVLCGHSHRRQRFYGSNATYKGLITCSVCGCSVTPDTKTKKQKNGNVHHYVYYHCTNGKDEHLDKVHSIEERKVNAIMEDLLGNLIPPKERIVELRKMLSEAHAKKNKYYEVRRGELEAAKKQIQRRQRNLFDKFMDNDSDVVGITQEFYDENMSRYTEELAEIERQQQKLDDIDQGYYVTVEYLLNLFEHAADIFKVANSSEKRQILSMLLSNLQFDGENLTYTLKEPLGGLFLKKRSSVWQGRTESNHDLRFWRPLY